MRLLLLILLLAGRAGAATPEWAVRVVTGDGSGSGTVIASDGRASAVLTCRHVCDTPGAVIDVRTARGRQLKGSCRFADRRADLAVLVVEGSVTPAPIAAEQDCPAFGAELRQWGAPGWARGQFVAKEGAARGYVLIPPRRMWDYSTGIRPDAGDSGCGVFDARRRLVAVCWGFGPDGAELAVGLPEIWRFLRECGMVGQ